MSPIFDVLYVETISPYLDGDLEMNQALSQGLGMMKNLWCQTQNRYIKFVY